MIVLDTQVVSQLQRGGAHDRARLRAKLELLEGTDVSITVMTPYEQLNDCLGQIRLNRQSPRTDERSLTLLVTLLEYFSAWTGRFLPFDEPAVNIFSSLVRDARMFRAIGAIDARIAAIALAHRATLITANVRDFQQVPGLVVENW